ncbi:hypothetical protein F4677DRAFT_160370 [Hypoxylon crocopeplum]|nr:hypothetical protein F4677DRAFT_160370 [Hypoxylon crocopeplum]
MADVYRRSGRGGAGNFYSQKDIDEVTQAEPKDLEAQKPQPPDDYPTDPADVPPDVAPTTTSSTGGGSSAQTYARTGRGGAGNFVDPTSAPSSSTAAPPTTTTTTTTSPSVPNSPTSTTPNPQPQQQQVPPPPSRNMHSGRGGAGNWTTTAEGVYDPEQERKRREALDAHILQDIRDSLPQPPKIHYMHGPGRGRKPDLVDA